MTNKTNLDILFEDGMFLEEVKDLVYETVSFEEAFNSLNDMDGKVLAVFDFDDTLVTSNSMVYINRGSKKIPMTPAEYATYEPKDGDDVDFSEFDKVIDPKIIQNNFKLFKDYISNPSHDTVILTARADDSQDALREYLESVNVDTNKVEIVTVGSSSPLDKAKWVHRKVKGSDYDRVEFFDDSLKNVKAVKNLDSTLDAEVHSHHVKHVA